MITTVRFDCWGVPTGTVLSMVSEDSGVVHDLKEAIRFFDALRVERLGDKRETANFSTTLRSSNRSLWKRCSPFVIPSS